MLKNVKIGPKLTGGFVLVALLAVFGGGGRPLGRNQREGQPQSRGPGEPPDHRQFAYHGGSFERARVAQRTLLSPGLNDEDHQRQFDNIAKARGGV
jgi:methyl-accepting chemotaxis protein